MKSNTDSRLRVVMVPGEAEWIASPLPGVTRRMLERDGGEVARATSVVRYEVGARFSPHQHGGGEEFLVLEGTFCDELGEYPAGTYVRNPPGSAHGPWSASGCTLLVKLRQFDPGDLARVVIDTAAARWRPGTAPGLSSLPLHRFGDETVELQRWLPGTGPGPHDHSGGEEIYVLKGGFADERGAYPAGTWIRDPAGSAHDPSSSQGCHLYVKAGHLARP